MLFRLRGSLTTFTIGRWRSLLHVLCMFAPIKWKACGTLQGNPLDFATKQLVQAFSEVSASGLSTSASTDLALVFVCHQWVGRWEFTNATELQVSKQKQPLHPVFPPMSRGMATAKKEIQTVALESIQRSSKWGYMKRLELNELPPTVPGNPNLYAQRRPLPLPGYPWVLGHAESACGLWAKIVSRKPSA